MRRSVRASDEAAIQRSTLSFDRLGVVQRETWMARSVRRSLAAIDALDLEAIADASAILRRGLEQAGTIFVAGNGGSAAQAEHFCAELLGRFRSKRAGVPARNLGCDLTTATAIANDFGFSEVFARTLAAAARPGDVVVLISTSGESENILRAADQSLRLGLPLIALTGAAPNSLAARATVSLVIEETSASIVQEAHLVALHLLAEAIDASGR